MSDPDLNQANYMRNAATKLPEIRHAAQEVAGSRGSAMQMLASWCTPSDVIELLDHIEELEAEKEGLRSALSGICRSGQTGASGGQCAFDAADALSTYGPKVTR
jgi:hypothetical protein